MSDLTKLPKWARDLIASKDRQIEELRSDLNNLKLPPEEGDFFYQNTRLEKFYLPKGIALHIPVFNPKLAGDAYMICRQPEGREATHGDLSLRTKETSLLIEPQASNSVHLFTRKR